MYSVRGILMLKFRCTTNLIIVRIVKLVLKLVIWQYAKAHYCGFDRLWLSLKIILSYTILTFFKLQIIACSMILWSKSLKIILSYTILTFFKLQIFACSMILWSKSVSRKLMIGNCSYYYYRDDNLRMLLSMTLIVCSLDLFLSGFKGMIGSKTIKGEASMSYRELDIRQKSIFFFRTTKQSIILRYQ